MRNNHLPLFVSTILVAGLIIALPLRDSHAESDAQGLEQLTTIPEVMSIIQNNYVESVDVSKLLSGALRGMVDSLDPDCEFLTSEAAKDLQSEAQVTPQPGPAEIGGVGLAITKREGFITVVSPIPGAPADRAGLKPGDRIVKINSETLRDPDIQDVATKLRGEPGTEVAITVLRGKDTIKTYTLKRATVKLPSVIQAKILEDGIGYIKVTQFHETTPQELKSALADLSNQSMNSLILDLRDNPGGSLTSAVDVVDPFVPEGQVVVSTKGRRLQHNQQFRSKDAPTHPTCPLALLINDGTAKGAEIVAAAIKDLKRGVLVGETTFGGGTIQSIFRLKRGATVRLTTAKWYTPRGICIHGKGVEPHIVVEETPEQKQRRMTQPLKNMEKALREAVEPTGKAPEQKEFVDIQLLEAVRALKALRATQSDSNPSPSSSKTSNVRGSDLG